MKRYQSKEMIDILRMHIFKKYGNKQANFAKAMNVSGAYITMVINGERQISPHIAKELGFKRIDPETYYVRVKK